MTEKDAPPSQSPNRERNSRDMGRQLIGAAVGAFVALAVVRVGESLGWQITNPTSIILLGGAIGAVLNDLERFDQAGSRLTRRPSNGNRATAALNIGVALLGLLLVMGLVLGLSALIGLIL
jgi:hypothetical protein